MAYTNFEEAVLVKLERIALSLEVQSTANSRALKKLEKLFTDYETAKRTAEEAAERQRRSIAALVPKKVPSRKSRTTKK